MNGYSHEDRHDALLMEVARRYWDDRRTQQEIGEEFGYSRVNVSRLLDEARRRGVVRVSIGPPLDLDRTLGRDLGRALRAELPGARALASCRVVTPTTRGEDAHRRQLGRHAALVIAEAVSAGGRLSIASSRTMSPVAAAAHLLPRLRAVHELLGTPDREGVVTAGQTIAAGTGARHVPVPAPFILRSATRAAAARVSDDIAEALADVVHTDAAVFGAGSVRRFDGTGMRAPVSAETLRGAAEVGAIGHALGIFYDEHGRQVDMPVDALRVGVSADAFLRIRRRVLLAWGAHKASIVRVLVGAGFVTDLITDEPAARGILTAGSS